MIKYVVMFGYDFKGNKGEVKYKLPPVSNLEDKILNPVVLRAVSETRKVINAIIDKYGSPTALYIETARDLSKSYEEREGIIKKQLENKNINEKLKNEIKEIFGMDAKPFDIVKMKLWKEQGGKCVYSGKPIQAERLYEENFVQVDHIIPFSRCFDNSYQNKVLVLTDENQRKRERTPYEYFGEDKEKWHSFEEFVNVTYKSNFKKRENLLLKNFNEEKSKEWLSRNINDTRYIAKFLYNYITNNLQFAESELKRKVYNINGQATATLRQYFGLAKNREESDKHHALDAVIIACANNKNIKKVSEYYKKRNEYKETEKYEEPWCNFRQEVEARLGEPDNKGQLYDLVNGKFYNYDDLDVEKIKPILVSRKPERKITGRAHKDTMYSRKFMEQGFNFKTVKKNLKNISKNEITDITTELKFKQLYMSDKAMYDDIYKKMQENDFKAEKAFANGYRKHSKKGEGPIVRSITIPVAGESGVELKRNKAIADNDSMVRVDVFEKDNKYYLVPIYIADFVKKQLPNKAIVANKSEKDWIEMTDEYKFKFSLYKNDLVRIKKKGENAFISYYQGTHRGTAAIRILKDPNLGGDSKENTTDCGSKTLEIFEKYQVDVLGNISKVKSEKRKGVIKK